jgi:hypothetical protein
VRRRHTEDPSTHEYTHTEFERYYQQVRSRQKRDTFSWSLLLLALYFAAGSAAEFNLFTIWHSLPNFLDYMFETLPTLHVSACSPMSTPKARWPTGAIVCRFSCR